MEISHITNFNEVGKTIYQNIDTFPFFKKSIQSYAISEYDFGLHDFHSCRLIYFENLKEWYCYFYAKDTSNIGNTYVAKTANPCGTWELVLEENGEPLIFNPTGTIDDKSDSSYYQAVTVVKSRKYYRAWFQYKNIANDFRCGYCVSTDLKNWTGATKVVFDSSITNVVGTQGKYLSVTDVTYDYLNDKYIGLAHVTKQIDGNSAQCIVITSVDGINWSLLSVPNVLDINIQHAEAMDSYALERFGSIWVIMAHRYDHSEGAFNKNCTFAISADLVNWETIIHPMLDTNSLIVKYPSIRQAINSIYFVWVSGKDGNNKLAFGRMEHSDNPPIEKKYSSLVYNTPSTMKYYGNGDVKARIEIKATTSIQAEIKVEVFPVFTDNARTTFYYGSTPSYTKTLNFAIGTDLLVTDELLLPHLYDVKLTNLTDGASVSNVNMHINFIK